jgi:lysylphosphatidylglycerol synthetase-like protein (DUF2156 family)
MPVFVRSERASPADSIQRERAGRMIEDGAADALAPFVLRVGKSYFESSDGRALLAYRVRLGTAVVSGDPVGDSTSFQALADEFVDFCTKQRWRLAVLGAGEGGHRLWLPHRLSPFAIGRDVVITVDGFTMTGRRYRNLRQAVRRSDTGGVTVRFHREGSIGHPLVTQLLDLRVRAGKTKDRGFSMLLGNLLDGTHPNAIIAVARDRDGSPVAFQRYLRSGKDGLTLDLPVRDPSAPNGTEERLVIETVRWAGAHDFRSVSLSFAPFADLYGSQPRSAGQRGSRAALRLLDPFVRVEPLYMFLRKFHALQGRRFVMLRRRQVVRVTTTMLLLEFGAPPDEHRNTKRRFRPGQS